MQSSVDLLSVAKLLCGTSVWQCSAGVSPRLQLLVGFQRLCQPGIKQSPVHLPLLFLTVQTFGLQLACLANVKYPLSAIGSVLTGYRALLLREYDCSKALTFRCSANISQLLVLHPATAKSDPLVSGSDLQVLSRLRLSNIFQVTAAGNVEFETVCEARDAATGESYSERCYI